MVKNQSQTLGYVPLILALRRLKQVGLCKVKASPVFTASSRPAKTAWWEVSPQFIKQ